MSGVGGVDEVEVHQEGDQECSVVTDNTLTSSSQAMKHKYLNEKIGRGRLELEYYLLIRSIN